MDFDTQVKLAIYHHFAGNGRRPTLDEVARGVSADAASVRAAYGRLREQRVLVLEPDGASIRMAPPFSGIATLHAVEAGGIRYDANCAWDAFGVAAALHKPATIHSRCAQSDEPLRLHIGADGPEPCDWVFHSLVPAARWWDDIVFT
jgi:hypothetical protein